MSEPLTSERLAEIRKREQAAPAGPWRVVRHEPSLTNHIVSADHALDVGLGYIGNRTEAEGEFIAHARTDIPDLLAEIERLRAQVPSWADLHALLVEHRDSSMTDNELTNKVMALLTGGAS